MTPTVFLMAVLGIVLAIGELAIGVGVGWYLRGRVKSGGWDRKTAQEMLARLQKLASEMSDHVGVYAQRIDEAVGELSSADLDSPGGQKAVFKAVDGILSANEDLQAELSDAQEQIEQQTHVIEEHAESAGTDLATGLPNRRGFDADLRRRVAQWDARQVPLSVVVIDVDNLSEIDQEHGPEACDAVLKGLADVLCQATRNMDVVARYRPDGFAVMLPSMTLDEATRAAQKMRAAVAKTPLSASGYHGDVELSLTVTEGVAEVSSGDDVDSLMNRAERALLSARKAGNNRAHVHDGFTCQEIPEDEGDGSAARSGVVDLDLNREAKQFKANAADPRIDSLTGQFNRRALFDYLREQVARHELVDLPLSLILFEIDQLDRIVARHGQQIGDVVIRALAQIIRTATRDRDHVARYDAGTLALVVPEVDLSEAVLVAERIRRAISACRLRAGGGDLTVTVSVGVAESSQGDNSITLTEQAASAVKLARISGRDRTYCWDSAAGAAIEALPAEV